MICPTCHNVMIVVEHEQIELDYCTSCSGVWFDSGELELMLERMGLAEGILSLDDILTVPEAETAEGKRKCPICRRKMRKTATGKNPQVLIDVCPNGDGLWFDGGEVAQLMRQFAEKPDAESDSQGRIMTFLRDTFKGKPDPDPK